MSGAIFGLVVAVGLLAAYHAGKAAERRQVHEWLRYLHGIVDEVGPRDLAARISVGDHYEWEKD